MDSKQTFTFEAFIAVLAEIFGVDVSSLHPGKDLAEVIKDSIDLGELVAVLEERHSVAPKDWELFKTKTAAQEVFDNFA